MLSFGLLALISAAEAADHVGKALHLPSVQAAHHAGQAQAPQHRDLLAHALQRAWLGASQHLEGHRMFREQVRSLVHPAEGALAQGRSHPVATAQHSPRGQVGHVGQGGPAQGLPAPVLQALLQSLEGAGG